MAEQLLCQPAFGALDEVELSPRLTLLRWMRRCFRPHPQRQMRRCSARWAINGPLTTAKPGHSRHPSGTFPCLRPTCTHADRDLQSWPCEFDSRHPLHMIAPIQGTLDVGELFEQPDDKNCKAGHPLP